jgi:hypothetical protein
MELDPITQQIVETNILTYVVNSIVNRAQAIYDKEFLKGKFECRKEEGYVRDACIIEAKRRAQKKKMDYLVQQRSQCNKARNPQKCQHHLTNRIEKANRRLDRIQLQMKIHMGKIWREY